VLGIGLLSLVLLLSAGEAAAEPVGLISINCDDDAAVAEAIFGTAYARVGNRFLVAVDSGQQALVNAAGLQFQSVLGDVDPEGIYQIYDLDHPRAPEIVALDRFGELIDLGQGVRIMRLSRAEAASVSDSPGTHAVKLTDLAVPFFFPRPAICAALADDYPTDSLAYRINQDSLHAYVQRLEDFQTRYAFTDSCQAARRWIVQKFRDWGYTVIDTPWFYSSGWHYNVKVTKPGVVEPDKVIVIGGHYDSIVRTDQQPGRWEYAPGADDDGSGVALTMEIARVLADVPLRKTVIFMPFAAEEIGLLGSWDAATNFRNEGTKLEVMYNFDMVAYTEDSYWDLDISSGDITAYRNFTAATANRVSELIPIITYMGSSSDHYSFDQNGFAIVDHIESDFNTPGWHTNLDLTSRLNFSYFAEVAKTALVALAVVADAAYPVAVESVVDVGDGESLEVGWSDCSPDCSYKVYWGTESGHYIDSASVLAGECGYRITGLVDGQEYHVLAIGESPNGYRGFYGIEGRGTPWLYPRVPSGIAGVASANQLRLTVSWQPNSELDLSHYNVYRRFSSIGVWVRYAEGLTGTSFSDYDVVAQVGYEYAVTAVDVDGYESALSESVLLFPATFDGGLVIADGFVKDHTYDPDQAEQEAWLDTILGGVGFGVVPSDENGGPVTLSDIGRYGTLMWIDDDVIVKNIALSGPALDEFSQHGTDMLISGYSAWYQWAPKSVPTSHLLYREFGLSSYDYTAYFDFVGAFGQDGWPSVQIDPTRGMHEWRDVAKLTPRPGAQVILRFDSYMDLPEWENQPVGLAYETANGRRVLLSFPLYYLTPSSAEALMGRVLEYFGISGEFVKGDLDHSGTIDILDLALLIDHLYISLRPLPYPELADMDTRPGVSIGDVYFLLKYLFLGGPAPSR
jgi:hypothetical protein